MANRIATAIRRIPEVDYTLVTVAGDGAGTQNIASLFVKLKPIEARDARPVRDHGRGARRDSGAVHAQGVRASVGGGGGGGGGGGVQFVFQGPSWRSCSATASSCSRRSRRFPAWSMPTPRSTSASRRCRSASIVRRRPTSACRWRTPPTRCGCWSAATP